MSGKPVSVTSADARGMILNAQLLHDAGDSGPGGLCGIVGRLGYIQIDTIHIVERAHHHVFWTRLPEYSADILHRLQAVDRRIFEYWAHAMAYRPMADYRYCLYRMENFRKNGSPWIAGEKKLPLARVLSRIRAEGPLTAGDFEPPKNRKTGPWWDWKPAKQALELLFWRGDLMISERRNFQKVYDLTERVLPADVDTRKPEENEMARFLALRALTAMGMAEIREIHAFLQPATARDSESRAASWEAVARAVDELEDEGAIEALAVEGAEDRRYYALRGAAEKAEAATGAKPTVRLLSPFDNLVIQRERLRRMFDFDYVLECYLPASKRIHGYFSLPILFGTRFAGRMDPKADRKTGTLIVQSVTLEKDFPPTEEFITEFAHQLVRFAAFNRCERVSIGSTRPAKIKAAIRTAIKEISNDGGAERIGARI